MMYALNIEVETSRVLSATFEQFATEGMPLVETLPEGNISDYLFAKGKFVLSPLPVEKQPIETKEPETDFETRLANIEKTVDTMLTGGETE